MDEEKVTVDSLISDMTRALLECDDYEFLRIRLREIVAQADGSGEDD